LLQQLEDTAMQLTGIHHLTAITANASRNHHFYTSVLGLRLVKKTVNQDDTSAYHLFYADGRGRPGSDMTFFEWPVPPARHGGQSISGTSFRVPKSSLAWWRQRFESEDVPHRPIVERAGRDVLDFTDPEGQRLTLVADEGAGNDHVWPKSPVPPEHQLRGLGPITLTIADLKSTEKVLTAVLNMRKTISFANAHNPATETHVFEMGDGGPGAELHLSVEPDLPPASQGAGGIHHVAFRAPDEAYEGWANRLHEFGVPSSGPVDRFYFRSLYFREPNGNLFEIATDGPGFAEDEPMDSLGESLALPPFLEPRRAQIEARLEPIKTGSNQR
jgi:glyoxalase family protein